MTERRVPEGPAATETIGLYLGICTAVVHGTPAVLIKAGVAGGVIEQAQGAEDFTLIEMGAVFEGTQRRRPHESDS